MIDYNSKGDKTQFNKFINIKTEGISIDRLYLSVKFPWHRKIKHVNYENQRRSQDFLLVWGGYENIL